MKHKSDDRLLDRQEVQARFGISKRYLELAAMRGEGPQIVRIGRLAKYRVADIEAWIDRNTTGKAG